MPDGAVPGVPPNGIAAASQHKILEQHSGLLDDLEAAVGSLVEAFRAAGWRFYVVGGWVRDLLLSGTPDLNDIDVTTDARPQQIKGLLEAWADTTWDAGIAFGTVAGRSGQHIVEVTTHRGEQYRRSSRKPEVSFSDDLVVDLGRRDFTVNAMAIELPERKLIDPYDGLADLHKRVLRAPDDPKMLFSEDPLRILRAARFAATLGLTPETSLVEAMVSSRERLEIVSAERLCMELQKLLSAVRPGVGVALLERTGVLAVLGVRGIEGGAEVLAAGVNAVAADAVADTVADTMADTASAHDTRWAVMLRLANYSPDEALTLLRGLRYSTQVIRQVAAILSALAQAQALPDEALRTGWLPAMRAWLSKNHKHFQATRRAALAINAAGLSAAGPAAAGPATAGPATEMTSPASSLTKHNFDPQIFENLHRLTAEEDVPLLGHPLNGNDVKRIAAEHDFDLEGAQIGAALDFLLNQHIEQGPLTADAAAELLVQHLRSQS